MTTSSIRPHLGAGPLELKREYSVFINCPYDDIYRPMFDALIFATLCCGFTPRSAIESGTASISRMDRIVHTIRSSKYSIHELSRCIGEGEANLARFNMPLELGIAMAFRFGVGVNGYEHDWLPLVPRNHSYKRFISDLSGYDPNEHDETVETIIPSVMSWLATRPDAIQTPTPQDVLEVLPYFQSARENLGVMWCGCEPWADLLMIGLEIAHDKNLIPFAS